MLLPAAPLQKAMGELATVCMILFLRFLQRFPAIKRRYGSVDGSVYLSYYRRVMFETALPRGVCVCTLLSPRVWKGSCVLLHSLMVEEASCRQVVRPWKPAGDWSTETHYLPRHLF